MKSNTVQILTTVLSNVAVLAGLVFLIFELRQNSAIALSQMTQERAMSYIDQHASYAADKDFSELYARVYFRCDFDSVTKDEWDQITRFEETQRTRLRDVWFQANAGLIDQKVYFPSISTAARRLQLWYWLKVYGENRDTEIILDIKERLKDESFDPTDRGIPFMTKFKNWSKDKKSPHEI